MAEDSVLMLKSGKSGNTQISNMFSPYQIDNIPSSVNEMLHWKYISTFIPISQKIESISRNFPCEFGSILILSLWEIFA